MTFDALSFIAGVCTAGGLSLVIASLWVRRVRTESDLFADVAWEAIESYRADMAEFVAGVELRHAQRANCEADLERDARQVPTTIFGPRSNWEVG